MKDQAPERMWVWRGGAADWTDIVSAHHKPFHFISKKRLVQYIRRDAISMSHVDKAEAWDAIAAKNREIAELRAENASLRAQIPVPQVGLLLLDEPGKITPEQFSVIVERPLVLGKRRVCSCEDCTSSDPLSFIYSGGNYYCYDCFLKFQRAKKDKA